MIKKQTAKLINNIIKEIYNCEDCDEMRLKVLEMIHLVVPYLCASFFLASEDKAHLLASPVAINVTEEVLCEYVEMYEWEDPTRHIFSNGESQVYRESDYLSKESLKNSEYYNCLWEQAEIDESFQISIAAKGVFLGIITLFKRASMREYNDDDRFLLELLLPHLEKRLEKEKIKVREMREYREIVFSNEEQDRLVQKYKLTPREMEIFNILLEGTPITGICEKLCISENTVRKHTTNIYHKLGIHNRWEIVKLFTSEKTENQ